MHEMHKKSVKPLWGGRGRARNPEKQHCYARDHKTSRPNDGSRFKNNRPELLFKWQTDKAKKVIKFMHCLDDDGPMPVNNRRQPVSRKKLFNPVPQRATRDGRQRQIPTDCNWYKISIPHGEKYTKEFVLGNLLSCIAPTTFTPFMYKIVGGNAIFYVEDYRVVSKLADCDKRITTNDGLKMQVRVTPAAPPAEISNELEERLKQAMGKRYLQETNALNLSKFYHDPELAPDYWCPLDQPKLLMTVLDIVQEYIPNLQALNLDCNKMNNIKTLNLFTSKFKNLKILHIGDNKIKYLNQLNLLKNLPLEELRLEGNPVCNKYKNKQEAYVSDIRKMFPKLLKLDGVELPPPILFDVEDQKLPPTQRMFIGQSNDKAREVATQFLQQYFTIFDSDNRQPLLDAYHEHACFSMTVAISQNSNKFSPYLSENRNLCRVMDMARRQKLLKHGRLPVVSFISEMPRTKHDLESFTMDLNLATEGMMLITVTGLFKELQSKENKEQLRYFNRTFTIVPQGAGFCISSEQLHISNPTINQEKQFECAAPVVQPTPESSTAPAAVPLADEVKQQMTVALSQQTNMNIEWCLKCLEELQWHFENARTAFQEAYSLGKIPPTAFIK